jgi:hypothetical protein
MSKTNLWEEKFDEDGRSSLQSHTPRVVWTSCKAKDHHYELTGNRECTCTKCGSIATIVLGMQILTDGKIIQLR